MNPNVKTFQDFGARQKFARFSVQAVGNVVTAGVVIVLVLAWILTSPFFQFMDHVAGSGKVKTINQ